MADSQPGLNGSVDRLADALRETFRDAAREAIEPIATEFRDFMHEQREVNEDFRRSIAAIGSGVSRIEQREASRPT